MKQERIEIPVTDGTAWLDKLTPRMMIAVGDRIWCEQRTGLIEDLKNAEVDSTERVAALRELNTRRGLMSEVVHYAISVVGAMDVIKEAARSKTAENADGLPDSFTGTSEEAIKIALGLIGAELEDEPKESKESDKPKSKPKKKATKSDQDG